MATRIRLRRMGSNKRPFYRVVVADQRAPRDGRFIESIGKYHPLSDPSLIEIDEERALHWLRVGAQPSNQVRNLMSKVGIWETFVTERPGAMKGVKPPKTERPDRPKLSKKAQAKAAEGEPPAPAAPVAEAPTTDEPAATDETAAGDGTPDAPAEQPAAPSEAEPEVAQEVAEEAQAEAGEE